MLAYDENGVIREFYEHEGVVVCSHCYRLYKQLIEEQIPGFREVNDDICPYCKKSNGRSSDVEFYNYVLSMEELSNMKDYV